jgi:F-type H+-transporting ATPase subunit c
MRSKTRVLILLAVVLFVTASVWAAEPAKSPAPAGGETLAVKLEATKGVSWMLIAAVLGMALAAAGAAVSQAITASAALQGIARQPEASGKLFVPMILAIVFIETLAIYTLVLGLLFIFLNPLKGMLG